MGLFGPTRTTKEKRRLNRLASESMRPGFIRFPLYILLGLALYYGYSWNFDRRFSEIEAKSSFQDQTGVWTKEDRQMLYRHATEFRKNWGMKILVHVRSKDIIAPVSVGNTIFIGVVPSTGEALIVLPALADRAMRAASAEGDAKAILERDLGLCARTEPNSAPCVITVLQSLNTYFSAP